MTGTPLDLTPFGSVLTGVGVLYWLLAAFALWLALRGRRPRPEKVFGAFLVAFLFGLYPAYATWQRYEASSRLNALMARFNERCKSAGEKVNRTVENVDGVVWMKWREPISNADNFASQFKLNDPYGQDCGEQDCIANLLRATKGSELNPEEAKRHSNGYRFVETIDPSDGIRYRYVAVIKLRSIWTEEAIAREKQLTGKTIGPSDYAFAMEREPIDKYSARYGITWDDISTQEDREHWIAGGSLKVIDLQTNEVIAERDGYMMDIGQGSQEGFRSPWLYAQQTACPEFPRVGEFDPRRLRTLHETRDFALKVLQQSKEEK